MYRSFIQKGVPTTRDPRSINGVQRLSSAQLLVAGVPHFRGGHPLTGQNDLDLWTIRQKIDLRKL